MVGNVFHWEWEIELIKLIQNSLGNFGVKIMGLFSELGDDILILLILMIFYLALDKEFGKKISSIIVIGTVCNPLIKNIFFRARPYVATDEVKCLKAVHPDADIYDLDIQGYSFPSGHTTSATTTYGTLALKAKKPWVKCLCYLAIALVAFSRFALGVHYPTDVLVGFVLGTIVIFSYLLIERKLQNSFYTRLIYLGIGFIGFFYCKSNDFYTGYGMLLGMTLGFLFEEKKVNFELPHKKVYMLTRILVCGLIYFGLNFLLKAPFSTEFLDSSDFLPHIVRALRYAIISFVMTGIYPVLFKFEDRIEHKR